MYLRRVSLAISCGLANTHVCVFMLRKREGPALQFLKKQGRRAERLLTNKEIHPDFSVLQLVNFLSVFLNDIDQVPQSVS